MSNAEIKNSCAKPEEPLSKEESSKYYDLDTFDKSLLIENKEVEESSQSEEDAMSQDDKSDGNGNQDDETGESESDAASINNSQLDSENEIDIDSIMEEDENSNSQSASTKIINNQTKKEKDQNAIEGIDSTKFYIRYINSLL